MCVVGRMKVAGVTWVGVQLEGNLLAADITTELIAGSIRGQSPEDFGLAKSDRLEDEIASAWGEVKLYWAAFQRQLARLDEEDTATTITREMWAIPLLRSLGYNPIHTPKAEVVDGHTFAISHRAETGDNQPPIHIIGCRLDIDKRPPSGTPRLSAHALVQEYLNRTEHLWAITTNGLRWRLLRDSSLMTRLTYIEFDLEQILNGENFAEFGLFYRLFHRSRLPKTADDADECLLEYYHQESLQQGGRVRDRLRDGVEKALIQLGNGFLQHIDSGNLRQKLTPGGGWDEIGYYRQLLRLIYRLLFLMVAESRNLLFIGEDLEKARIYTEYYSVERLRRLAERPRFRREGFQDNWQGLRVTFKLFDENWRGKVLELSPLNGDLFGSDTLKDLDDCAIDNYDLLIAIRHLSLYEDRGQLRRVNYAALDVEELGSVYESLLDFHPQVRINHGIYEFNLVFGSERKTTGSYYTPPQLVQQLIKTALEPVIEEKLQGEGDLEQALLSLKIVDPACGSGHFLLAAARRVGKELAKIRTGETQPPPEPLREAMRDVIQNCIYGVDLNPLAVDLCKVALWIEGFCSGKPLNFLDHRIKCGNSLVGVLDIECLDEGIPDEAFKAVTGDEKKLATELKKRNKRERETDLQGQLSLFGNRESTRAEYVESWRQLGEFAETTPQEVREKEQRYRQTRTNQGWYRDYSACNLWVAAFFMGLRGENLPLIPTTATLSEVLRGNLQHQELIDAVNGLAEEKHFFHWCLEFPEVFESGGFDCVLGNPPWERIKLQEKEFFAARSLDIANAQNKAAREKLIQELPRENPELAQAFEDAKHDAEAQGKFIREGGRFPLTAVGDINTYAVFAETTRKLISPLGRVGVIVPTGVATDDTCKRFFGDLIKTQALASLYDFENRERLFAAVDSRMKFSLLALTGKPITRGNFAFFLTQPKQLDNQARLFQLAPKDIALINPNTLTCPVFRSSKDADLTKKIYQRVPVLENEKIGSNPWGISFMAMFHMANDSGLFKNEWGKDLVPLYEAKMFHQFDHRWATYTDNRDTRDLTDGEKSDPSFAVQPRYWVSRVEVERKLHGKWDKDWLLGFRRICRSTDERTAIFSLSPKVAFGDSVFIMFPSLKNSLLVSCLYSYLNSLVFDFITRQKMGGTNFSFFILKQLPVLPPETYTEKDLEFIVPRVLELVYTAYDMQPFAQDLWGESGTRIQELIIQQWEKNQGTKLTSPEQPPTPFTWHPNRRALIRSELDAYYAKLYGLTRDELRYILDPTEVYGADFPSETFRVLKNNEIKQFGEYLTQRLVLESWDRMFKSNSCK